MSGLEIAGVLLGAFPLIISGLENWRDMAKVGGFFWRVRKEYTTCLREVQFYEILYKRNLKDLLLPIVDDAAEVTQLVDDPGGKGWSNKTLQERLEARLQESYELYMDLIHEMNELADELKKELAFDKATVQSKLAPPEPQKQRRPSSPQSLGKPSRLVSIKTKWDYETFRLKFSFTEPARNELFERLKTCNERLEKLLSTSDKVSALENIASVNTKQTSALESAFRKVWKKSDHLFKAIHSAWQCSCQEHHFANLRLEHRTLSDMCFDIILMYITPSPSADTPWLWRELQYGKTLGCSCPKSLTLPSMPPQFSQYPDDYKPGMTPPPTSAKTKKVAFKTPHPAVPDIEIDIMVDPTVKLCQLLGAEEHDKCISIARHGSETCHLYPITKRKQTDDNGMLTLDHILSGDFEGHLTRRQRYYVALLLASSVAQLQFTPWLNSGLTKEDIHFFPFADDESTILYDEPFIRQGFPSAHTGTLDTGTKDHDFASLGILLLELCFGRRLEDHPLRQKYPDTAGQSKQAFDLMAALKWCQGVGDEGGDEYASAVKWCFFTSATNGNKSWRGELIKNVIRPLEKCLECFKTVASL